MTPNSYQIPDPGSPSRQFQSAYQVAGRTLQRMFKVHSNGGAPEMQYRWIRSTMRGPAFDHLSFSYGDKLYTVLVDVCANARTRLSPQEIKRCLDAAHEHNLTPCVFQIDAATLRPTREGWNLNCLRDGRTIEPHLMSTNQKALMSEWELHHLAIQVVTGHVEDTIHGEIFSGCDVIGIDPQLWFVDPNGKRNWLIARFYRSITGEEKSEFARIAHDQPQLKPYNGMFAAVSACSAAPFLKDNAGSVVPLSRRFDGSSPLYRGEQLYVKFAGLELLHSPT